VLDGFATHQPTRVHRKAAAHEVVEPFGYGPRRDGTSAFSVK